MNRDGAILLPEPPIPVACRRCGSDLYPGQDPESCGCRYRKCVACAREIRIDEADGLGRCEECVADGCRKCSRCGLWRVAAEFGQEACQDCEWVPSKLKTK